MDHTNDWFTLMQQKFLFFVRYLWCRALVRSSLVQKNIGFKSLGIAAICPHEWTPVGPHVAALLEDMRRRAQKTPAKAAKVATDKEYFESSYKEQNMVLSSKALAPTQALAQQATNPRLVHSMQRVLQEQRHPELPT